VIQRCAVSAPGFLGAKAFISDALGRIVQDFGHVSQPYGIWETEELGAGHYFLQVSAGNRVFHKVIVVGK